MRQRQGAGIGRFTAPLAVLAALVVAPIADAASLARQCRQACGDEIAACVAAGGHRSSCRRQTLRRCRREGLAVCQGTSAGGNVTAVTAPLLAPTSLKATVRSAGEIDLSSTDTNSQEMGYLIERSVDPAGGFVQIAAVGINVHAYKNFGLSQTTTYYYRVRAFGSTDPASGVTDSFSPYSNVASGTTPADKKAPSTPSSLRAWAVACNQIALSWNSSTDGGTGVQAYNVFRGGVFLKQVPAPATSTTDSGVLPSTTYSYAVSAIDWAGNQSNRSGSVNVVTPTCPTTTSTSTTTSTTTTSTTTTTLDPPTTTTTTLPAAGGCNGPTLIPAQGGTFSGTTSGTSAQAGSCGSAGSAPEHVFQWTPAISGTATIQTCGAGTSFDTVLYMRSGACGSGTEVASGCNDDACPNASGANTASRITPTVTAGQTYFIIVDGYGLSQGNFTLTVVPPAPPTTTTSPPSTTTTTLVTTTTTSSTTTTTTVPTTTSTTSTTTTTRPPTTTTTTRPATTTTTTSSTTSTTTVPPTTTSTTSTTTTTRPPTTTTLPPTTTTTTSSTTSTTTVPPTTTSTTSTTTTTRPPTTTTTSLPATTTTTTTTSTTTSTTSTTLPPPTNLTATAPSCGEVDLRWTLSTGSVSGYNVYRKASTDATFTMVKQVGASPVFPVADTTPSAATTYTYGVTAWNSGGSSTMPTVLTNTPGCPVTVNPTLVGYVPAVGIAKDVAVDSTRGVAYVASTEFGISTVNVSNPSNPVAIGGAIPPFDGEELAISGSLGVAPVSGVGMEVFDLSTPSAPRLIGSLSAPVIHVALAGQTAYVAMVVSGNPAHVDLGVVNLTIPAAPSMIGRITLGPQVEKMRVVGSLLYVAAGSGGLQIVDVSSPTSPRILGAASISGHAYAVTVAGNFAYVAANTAIAAVNVAVPTAPVVVGTLGATAANAAAVVSTRLYVLDGGLLKIIDVSNPAAPLLLSTTDGFASVAIAVSGTQAFLASPSSIPPPEGGLYVLDVSSATAPTMLGGAHGGQYPTADVAVAGSMAVLSGQGTGMQVMDVSTPSAPNLIGVLSGYGVQRVALAGHTAYGTVTVQGNPSHVDLVVVDLTVPTSPTVIGRVTLGADAKQLRVVGSLLYVAAGNGGLQIVDVSSPTSPRVIGAIGMPSTAYGVTAANGYAYVADLTSVQVVNVSTPSRPVIVGSLTATATAAAVTGSRLYVVNGSQLLTIDVTNPASPLLLSTTTVRADYVDMCGTLVCAGARALNHSDVGGGLYVLDLSVPTTPQMLSHVIVPGTIGGVAANSSMLYAADNAGMIDIVSLGP